MRNAATTEKAMVKLKMRRPPKRSVSRPSGIRPRLPRRTGIARAMLTCTGARWNCFLSTGIMAETEPKTAKQSANAPVPRVSCRGLERELAREFMSTTFSRQVSLHGCDENHIKHQSGRHVIGQFFAARFALL